ncbi:MAG TPA: NAD(P)-dependent oxidoreductase [Chryseosolibacter sp.]
MKRKKCLIIDSMHPSLFSMLENIGWEYDYKPDISVNEIKTILPGYDGLIVRSKTTVDCDLLGNSPTVRFVGRAGAGVDNVDVDYLKEKNIQIIHAAEGNRDAVGEFTIGLLLALMRNIPRADNQVRNYVWDREGNRGEELNGKTVALIGYGNMGQAFAKRLTGFGCKVLAFDKYKSGYASIICEEVRMEMIFEQADILSLHIPLTAETRRMVDTHYLNCFKKSVIVLNTARGEIVSLSALANAIESGKVRGAALDVLENEKLNTLSIDQKQALEYLKSRSNVIFTPHIAGWTYESHVKINVALIEKIKVLDV